MVLYDLCPMSYMGGPPLSGDGQWDFLTWWFVGDRLGVLVESVEHPEE